VNRRHMRICAVIVALGGGLFDPMRVNADVRAWEGEMTIPTYVWQEDINPKFWAIEGGAKMSTTVRGAIVYPYVMQDHLLREKVDRTYKALFLENEYLKVTCLPELGGRLHSVLDKTEGAEMFYCNGVIKPGMIAMRGAWISGGVEWNTGPHGHTVTAISPVNALIGTNADGSAYVEISNQEQLFRTRWNVRVTLHPGRAYLDERISMVNPTDGMHPYYFWNCTAFPNRAGTRFIYPMSLGTDHNARAFFDWPVDKGRDLSWLKNYPQYASIFAVNCSYDFFGAYDVDNDRGIIQVANRRELGGKKAWTWGEWEFGKVAQQNLTDDNGPYIEVQSGPLPTQSDYGMLGPRERVEWREWWYPVHGLGDGFEFATRNLAVQSARRDGKLELRLLATGAFPRAQCEVRLVTQRETAPVAREQIDLSPLSPVVMTMADPQQPVKVEVTSQAGEVLAAFQTPLPIPHMDPPTQLMDQADDQLTVEQLYLKARKCDRGTERGRAREYYGKALAGDPGHVASHRALAVLDYEAGLYDEARQRLKIALARDGDDGLCCYYMGVCSLQLGDAEAALDWAYKALRCAGTVSLGHDLAGRARMKLGAISGAVSSFENAVRANRNDTVAADHLLLALYAAHRQPMARRQAEQRTASDPTALVPRAIVSLDSDESMGRFANTARALLGEDDFELLETSLAFAEFGLIDEAQRIVKAACVDAVPPAQRSFMPFYYLAWLDSLRGASESAQKWLSEAARTRADKVFASRGEEIPILRYAIERNASDGQARLQLGCLLANLGRVDEAVSLWNEAAQLNGGSIAWRNLGLVAAVKNDWKGAEQNFRRAIAARPGDQTLYRDLAEILIADGRRTAAIELLEAMPSEGPRRAELTVILAESYVAEERYERCIELLESLPYFVNWEGQDVTWRLFNRAHVERGRQRLEQGDAAGALADCEAALTYPTNLNVGRSDQPVEAPAQFWRGQALNALNRPEEARAAWQAGADGADIDGWQNEHRDKCREALARAEK
jgi:tetratricopeptide (TPR) repeat protein